MSDCGSASMDHFCFVLIPGFSLVALSCAIDALRAANQISGTPVYQWQTVTPEGTGAISSSSITLPADNLDEVRIPDLIAICGGDRSHDYSNMKLTNWLQKQAKAGTHIGSISDGAFVLAEIGLFDWVQSTIHWKCYDAYRERFPSLNIRPSILEIASKRFSCAGGTSSLDLMLHFIREKHGGELAGQIADNYFHDVIRDGSREQHVTNAFRYSGRNPTLANALLMMEQNLEIPLHISQIADSLSLSRRQIDRIFNRELDKTPKDIYFDMRLNRANGLLVQTGMSITEIAIGCGFQSASHLSKYFTRRFNVTPGQYRRENKLR